MTVLNRLLRDIKKGAGEVQLRSCDIRTIAEHVRLTEYPDMSIDELEEKIRRGEMKLLGRPVRVR